MKAFAAILLLGLAGYFGYTTYFKAPERPRIDASANAYSLRAVESNPIPRKEFFELWTDTGFTECESARSRYNIAPEKCMSGVREKSGVCTVQIGRGTPAKIADSAVSAELGKKYLACVMPQRVCGGQPINTEEDARQFCK
jgi:hypothetical protein